MDIPRLCYFDSFFVWEDGRWRRVTPDEIVRIYNAMASRYEVVLSDIEDLISGHSTRGDSAIHPGTASVA